jgi:hypothetical protein
MNGEKRGHEGAAPQGSGHRAQDEKQEHGVGENQGDADADCLPPFACR